MSSTNGTTTAPVAASNTLSDTEWIVIVVVLVIILIVLVTAVIKCLEIGKSPKRRKQLLQDGNSVRSGTVRSTTRSIASTKMSNGANMKKMPLNAEITRFSAGRVSRSAEYGVVIKDIGKTVQTGEDPPPMYQEQVNTLHTYRPALPHHQQQTLPQPVHQAAPQQEQMPTHTARKYNTLTSPPNGNLIINQQGLAPPNSKAVFVASDDAYKMYPQQTVLKPAHMLQQPSQMVVQPNQIMVDMRYPILTQPAVMLQ